MIGYRFIFDNNCEKAAEFFPKRRVVTLRQAKLSPGVTDAEIVATACTHRWIIVTVNGDDFISQIKRYLRQTKKAECHDLSGLIILPSGHEVQREALKRIERRLIFGGKPITWKKIWELDCCVRVKKTGAAQITRFERCFYCRKNGIT